LISNDISLLPEYVEEILHLHVIPMRHQVGRNFILMQNARPHTARIVLKVPRRKQHRGAITSTDERGFKSHRTCMGHDGKKDMQFGKTANESPRTRSSNSGKYLPQLNLASMREQLQEVIRRQDGNIRF